MEPIKFIEYLRNNINSDLAKHILNVINRTWGSEDLWSYDVSQENEVNVIPKNSGFKIKFKLAKTSKKFLQITYEWTDKKNHNFLSYGIDRFLIDSEINESFICETIENLIHRATL
jgi:hypothetical protein